MKAMSNQEFAQAVLGMAKPAKPFRPTATYIPDGDCIEFVLAPDDYVARRLDGLVTVYQSRKSGEIVGALIKGVNSFCKKMAEKFPGFQIEITGRSIKLEYIFLAHLWTQERKIGEVEVRAYRTLIQAAKKQGIEVDIDGELTSAR